MKKFGITLVAAFLLCSLTASAVSAQQKKALKRTVTFSEDVTVNDATLKKGTYTVQFDSSTNEVIFTQGRKVALKTKATVEEDKEKARVNAETFAPADKGRKLARLAFAGDTRAIVIGGNTAASASQ